jgi:hypothetical protein
VRLTSPRKTHDVKNPNMWPRNHRIKRNRPVQWKRINEMTKKEWSIKVLLINLKEVGQEVDPNPDGGLVCKVI